MKKLLLGIMVLSSTAAFGQAQEQPKEVVVKTELLQATVQYLATKPYAETAKLISELVKVKPYVDLAPVKETKEEGK